MMAERTVLIAGRRESEDNLVKTIITLSSSLVALMAGFSTQPALYLKGQDLLLFKFCLVMLGCSITTGLLEQFFSSKAYQEQQQMLEDYYGNFIDAFTEARSNKFVRAAQIGSFASFVFAFCLLGLFAVLKAGEIRDVRHSATAATPSSSTTPSSSSSSSSSSTTTPSSSSSTPSTDPIWRGQGVRIGNKVGGSQHASATPQEGRLTH